MGKRKRERDAVVGKLPSKGPTIDGEKNANGLPEMKKVKAEHHLDQVTIQIVTGSYERVLHGITATLFRQEKATDEDEEHATLFADTFLFQAHSSAIRCLALSPPSSAKDGQASKIILASGGTDEKINLYHLSTTPPSLSKAADALPTLSHALVTENPKNRELGSLLHHSSSLTALHFPTRSKLLSSAEDNTVAVTRTSDWTMLSAIKAPIPKVLGRPSGDTAPPGGSPIGVNDFAVHPSMKLMLSVGKGEKCMRLWNLMTGKKAGVLNFGKEILQGVGEGRWGSGEGKRVKWNNKGDGFTVALERGAVVFGMDSQPKCRITPFPSTKIHQICYLNIPNASVDDDPNILALSTEDGRIMLYSTSLFEPPKHEQEGKEDSLCAARHLGQIGGAQVGHTRRIKDFQVLSIPALQDCTSEAKDLIFVAGSSDGSVKLWTVTPQELQLDQQKTAPKVQKLATEAPASTPKQLGRLRGTFETGNRIICLAAFVMDGITTGEHDNEEKVVEDDNADGSNDDSSH
ncbi:MAG: hypothetical protein M1829_000861 [Trizodia sp. TS-e1964]|nr:MAG: hypothetical protein M1829_000861 [Trizodia sp. TS-e1964]